MIKAIALSAFTHGALTLRRGDEAEFSPPTFTALAAHGLVRDASAPQVQPPQRAQRAARTPSNKKAQEPDNKTTTDAAAPGADQAAPAAIEGEPEPAADTAASAGDIDAAADA